jgi:hypothetical protein
VPRFYFHVFDDIVSMDEAGQGADDLAAARAIALDGARDLVCEQVHRGYLNLENYIVVADEQGQELSRIQFREAFKIRSNRGAGDGKSGTGRS